MYIESCKIAWFFLLPTLVKDKDTYWGIAFLWRVYWFVV